MSQRSVCSQFTPQLWRATKCKFCFNDKASHETASKENASNVNIPRSPAATISPKPINRLSSSFLRSEERNSNRRNLSSNSENDARIFSPDPDSFKNRPARIKIPTTEERENIEPRLSLTSPIDNINMRLDMNKQLLAKDDIIHGLEIRNQNLENEIRTLKDQNAQLALTQQSEEDQRKLLDKINSLRKKLSDMETKHLKMKEEKEDLEERLKSEEQLVSKLKIKINSMEHEHYLLELRVEREQKHKQSMVQEKDDMEVELESIRKQYRSVQRESRKYSAPLFDVDEERTRGLEDQLRQTQRRLGIMETENNRLKEKILKVEHVHHDNQITLLQRQLCTIQGNYDSSVDELEELRVSHLTEIQSLQTEISRLQIENEELCESLTKSDLEITQLKRRLADLDSRNSDNESRDEELQVLRTEVARLQDKCSALCDVELIHINLNKELDRHRERADRAELVVRQLERSVEDERRDKGACLIQIEQLREEGYKYAAAAPPRSRAQSLQPSLFSPASILKKNRKQPAERDIDQLSSSSTLVQKRTKPHITPPIRRYQSLQSLLHDRQRDRQRNGQTIPTHNANKIYSSRSVGDLKHLFESNALTAKQRQTRSVSFDLAVVHEVMYEVSPLHTDISRSSNSIDSDSESSYTYTDSYTESSSTDKNNESDEDIQDSFLEQYFPERECSTL